MHQGQSRVEINTLFQCFILDFTKLLVYCGWFQTSKIKDIMGNEFVPDC
jgi:hypothetical protein